jgi:ABC-type multidrug transport system ATPase subunit
MNDLLDLSGHSLSGLAKINILLGKNGCGKSRLLKHIEQALRNRTGYGAVRYISPERGGLLQYDPNIEHNLTSNQSWLADSRRQNQAEQFRRQSAAQFRRLELLTLREIEKDEQKRKDTSVTFDSTVKRINGLLDRVYLERTTDSAFQIKDKRTNAPVSASDISSGESELISLGIECLVFQKDAIAGKDNILLMDEPDVHLHPDLQARFARFIESIVRDSDVSVLIATHSTAFLGAMSDDARTRIAFMKYGETAHAFVEARGALRQVLPVFGAHPLSNVFNQAPVLLVEGEDDERIWQQAVRSGGGSIKIYPCSTNGLPDLGAFEHQVAKILEAVYDDARGFSLRDRDQDPGELASVGPVQRMRLSCHEAENLLVSDEVLAMLGVTWPALRSRIDEWLQGNPTHPHYRAMKAFADGGFDRIGGDLKEIRNDLLGIMNTNKPWEVIVGQAIASQVGRVAPDSPTSLLRLLGERAGRTLLEATY